MKDFNKYIFNYLNEENSDFISLLEDDNAENNNTLFDQINSGKITINFNDFMNKIYFPNDENKITINKEIKTVNDNTFCCVENTNNVIKDNNTKAKNTIISFAKNHSQEIKNYLKNNKNETQLHLNYEKLNEILLEQNSNTKFSYSPKNKNDFEELGKTLTFRGSATILSKDGDLTSCLRDIFENDSDGRIEAFTNINEVLSEAAAMKSAKEYLAKNENDNKTESTRNEVNRNYQILLNDNSDISDRVNAATTIGNLINKDYRKCWDEFQQAFDDGVKKMKEDMAKPDFDWKDPVTGKVVKGLDGLNTNFKKMAMDLNNKLGKFGKDLDEKIKSKEHTLENDLIKLGAIVFKGILGGVKLAGKFAKWFRNTQGLSGVINAEKYLKLHKDSKKKADTSLKKLEDALKSKTLSPILMNLLSTGAISKQTSNPNKKENFTILNNIATLNEQELSEDEQKELDNLKMLIKGALKDIIEYVDYEKSNFYKVLVGGDKNHIISEIDSVNKTYTSNIENGDYILYNIHTNYLNALKYFNRFNTCLSKCKNLEKDKKPMILGDADLFPTNFEIDTTNSKKLLKQIDKIIGDYYDEDSVNTQLKECKSLYSILDTGSLTSRLGISLDNTTRKYNIFQFTNYALNILKNNENFKIQNEKIKAKITVSDDKSEEFYKNVPISFGNPNVISEKSDLYDKNLIDILEHLVYVKNTNGNINIKYINDITNSDDIEKGSFISKEIFDYIKILCENNEDEYKEWYEKSSYQNKDKLNSELLNIQPETTETKEDNDLDKINKEIEEINKLNNIQDIVNNYNKKKSIIEDIYKKVTNTENLNDTEKANVERILDNNKNVKNQLYGKVKIINQIISELNRERNKND